MKKIDKIVNILDIPREVTTNTPKIVVTGFDEILIENYKGIMEYEEFFVKINTEIGIININGFNLKLEQMTNDDVFVKGIINSIDLERVS